MSYPEGKGLGGERWLVEGLDEMRVSGDEKGLDSRVRIEPAAWRDVGDLRKLEKAAFPKDAWPLIDLLGVLSFPNVVRLKAVVDDVMVGFVAADIRSREDVSWIATIGVLPAFRRRGIGRRLLEVCEGQLPTRNVRLCVRASNSPAIRLYEEMGYRRFDLWKRYYSDGEDALVMDKLLGV